MGLLCWSLWRSEGANSFFSFFPPAELGGTFFFVFNDTGKAGGIIGIFGMGVARAKGEWVDCTRGGRQQIKLD